jgi:hypothetical protein
VGRVAVVEAPPRGSLLIWCLTCGDETTAVKRHGPLPQHTPAVEGWWNICCVCGSHYAALPPGIGERHRTRMYVRRSGQLSLLNANPQERSTRNDEAKGRKSRGG